MISAGNFDTDLKVEQALIDLNELKTDL